MTDPLKAVVPLTVGSLFAGIGGLELGLERAGMRVVWQVEINEYCRKVLAKHWPDVKRYEDVRTIKPGELGRVDLVCGGFPCQPVSCAGQRKGDADERWLWGEMRRVCEMVRPRWVLAENVPGLLSATSGRLFGTVVRDLAALGYCVQWDCVSAASVGAPHIRDRVFILAHAKGIEHNRRREDLSEADGRQDGSLCGLAGSAGARPEDLAHDDGPRFADIQGQRATPRAHGSAFAGADHRQPNEFWRVEPDVGRVADGVPSRVDRLKGLGNAVVPQVAEFLGRMIVEADA